MLYISCSVHVTLYGTHFPINYVLYNIIIKDSITFCYASCSMIYWFNLLLNIQISPHLWVFYYYNSKQILAFLEDTAGLLSYIISFPQHTPPE